MTTMMIERQFDIGYLLKRIAKGLNYFELISNFNNFYMMKKRK